jgi:excisionase family DNA binding protein
MVQNQYLTVKEVAELLKVAENTVRGWVKSGELRAIDLGKGWRITAIDLQFFLDSKQTTPRPDAPLNNGAMPPVPEA